MLISVCKSKIHRATITHKDLNYVGSITIDAALMEAAGLVPYEKVQVANINTGARLETYVIEGRKNTGEIGLNGAAARLGEVGDLIIVISYGIMEQSAAPGFKPTVVQVDKNNKPIPS